MATSCTVYFIDGSYFDCKTEDSPQELKDRVIRSMKIHEPLVFERDDSQFVANPTNITFFEIKKTDESENIEQE